MYTLTLIRASLIATATSACLQGMSNLGSLFARFNSNPNASVPLFDSYAGGGHDDGNLPIHQVAAAAYSLGSREWNALVQTQSDQPVSVTVPSHSALPYAIGTRIMIEQVGAGPVTLQPDRNVILDGTLGTTRRNQLLTLIKTSSDRWLVTRQG